MIELTHTDLSSPLNREPPLRDLISNFVTSSTSDNHGAYDRNHGPIPHLSASTHIVRVDGLVSKQLELSIEQLKTQYEQHEVLCALQCAGNRRHTMRTKLKEVQGVDWFDGAVMNCRWKGPRLRDVLLIAGVELGGEGHGGRAEGDRHVAFACHQTTVQDDEWYGGSIELWRAMSADREVILALEMNGSPLPPTHGFPVRIIAPGVAGARSVKWLDRITVQNTESKNFYQTQDYKILPPEVTTKQMATRYWDAVPSIQDMPVNSVIGSPGSGETVMCDADGKIEVRGYALPKGNEGPVVKVEVSGDGNEWVAAELDGGDEELEKAKWAWVLWKARVSVEVGGGRKILSRAVDRGGNVQEANPIWNLRGVGYNGYGEVEDLTVAKFE